MSEHETHKRSLAKSMTWRIVATVSTVFVVFIFTIRLEVALVVGIFEFVSKFILYYAHERVWDRSVWRKKVVES